MKRSFAVHETWSPRLAPGPVLSVDFSGEVGVSGGLIAGGGVIHWFSPRAGLSLDLTFRALFGGDTVTVLSGALGVAIRI